MAGNQAMAADLNQYFNLASGSLPDQVLTPLAWGDRFTPTQAANISATSPGSTIYTVPASTVSILTQARVHNKTASGVTLLLTANGRPIVKPADPLGTVPAYTTYAWSCFRVLAAGAAAVALAGTGSALDCDLDVIQLPLGYVGVNFRSSEGSSLASGTQTLFTATSGKVAVVRGIAIENGSTAQTFILQKFDGTNAYELDRQNIAANAVYRLPSTIPQIPLTGGHSIRVVLTSAAGNYSVAGWETT